MIKKLPFRLLVLCLCLLIQPFYSFAQNTCLKERYVFDIGSSSIKSAGYIVNTCKNTIHRVISEQHKSLKIQQVISASSSGKTIPHEFMEHGMNVIGNLEEAFNIDCTKTECIGIATAWARNADNAQEFISMLAKRGLHIKILSQKNEGKVGFNNVTMGFDLPSVKARDFIVFDMGGGSFQLSSLVNNGQLHVHNGSFGTSNFHNTLIKKLATSVTKEQIVYNLAEAKRLAVAQVREDIKNDELTLNKLQDRATKVVGVGRFMGVGIKEQLEVGDKLTIHDIEKLLDRIASKNTDEIVRIFPLMPREYALDAQFGLLIIYAVMKVGNIPVISLSFNTRSTDYLAAYYDILVSQQSSAQQHKKNYFVEISKI